MKYIIKKLDKIGVQLFKQYGSDSYGIRCELHDLKEQLEALNIHDVIVPKGALVCEMRTSMGAENRCVYCGVEQGDECNWTN